MTRSAAGRLAGEALLVPTFALAPWIAWDPVDEAHAIARITVGGVRYAVEAVFDDGRPVSCCLPHWYEGGRQGRSRVFGVRFDGAVSHGGITMPRAWTAGWDWDGDDWRHGPFFRARLEAVRFRTARRGDRRRVRRCRVTTSDGMTSGTFGPPGSVHEDAR